MNRLLSGCVGCMAATISGLSGLAPNTPAGAGVLPLATAMLSSAVPAGVIAVQWGDAWWPRQPWDYAWGAPPYSFPQGRQAHVTYYAAAPYYYQWFQTTNGYNGHFGYPAAAQYADPPPVSRHDYPRPARRLEAFD